MKRKIAFAFAMGIITTGLISFILLNINTNFSGSKFLAIWLKSWGISYCIVIPCILLISPMVEKMLGRIIKE